VLIIPSIDLAGGRSRIVHWPGAAAGIGAPSDRPEVIAERFVAQGARSIHLVDFDGAQQGRPVNLEAVGRVAGRVGVPLQVAGGMEGADNIRLAFAAGATREFVVNEERVYDQSIAVTNLSPDILVSYLQNRSLTAAGSQQLQRIVDQKRLIAENDRALQDADAQTRGLNADEDRVRRNIQSLNNVAGQQQQVQTYARQLDAQEQQLAALRDKQAELQKKRSALQTDLDKLVEALTF